MAAPKPTIVLVPGAWHVPASFDLILPFLHAAGYPTTAVSLPSVGVSPAVKGFSPDVAAVRTVVNGLAELGRETVVVSHSYGGVATTEAVQGLSREERKSKGLPGGVVKLVYIAAILAKAGMDTMESILETPGQDEIPPPSAEDHGDGTTSALNGGERFYNDLSPELAKYYVSLLRTQSVAVNFSRLTYEGYRHIPSAYLICNRDQALAPRVQRRMVKDAEIGFVKDIDASHSPFLSQPEVVANFIREAVE
ncbi:hypothetical protein FQN54_004604 [Arachnomyces sp. PD_36]|nr:hypothetical protein FQN54_004604 [Arachnomyces sp. PD_36]